MSPYLCYALLWLGSSNLFFVLFFGVKHPTGAASRGRHSHIFIVCRASLYVLQRPGCNIVLNICIHQTSNSFSIVHDWSYYFRLTKWINMKFPCFSANTATNHSQLLSLKRVTTNIVCSVDWSIPHNCWSWTRSHECSHRTEGRIEKVPLILTIIYCYLLGFLYSIMFTAWLSE